MKRLFDIVASFLGLIILSPVMLALAVMIVAAFSLSAILKELDCPVVFCEDEEVGGVGSNKFTKTDIIRDLEKRINYVIDLDRKGNKDAVYYDLDNPDFEAFVEKEFWKGAYGSFTDICNICPELGVAGVNLSCGYYKQHTKEEYVVLTEMETAIEETKKLIQRTTEDDVFEYIEYKNPWGHYYGDFGYDYKTKSFYEKEDYYVMYYDVDGETVEYVYGSSEAEAIGHFLMDHPTLTYNDILDVGYAEDFDYMYNSYAAGGNANE